MEFLNNYDRSRSLVSQEEKSIQNQLDAPCQRKNYNKYLKVQGALVLVNFLEQTYLFMQTVQNMMIDILEWGKSNDKQIRKLQERLEQIHECVDRMHTDTAEVKEIKKKMVHQEDCKKEERKKEMEVQSIYAIIAGQTKINEHEMKISLIQQLQQDNRTNVMDLVRQDKWNHCIMETLSKVTKPRIVLFNSRTGRYKDFGDLKVKQKVMIYCRGSDCGAMKKIANINSLGESNSQAQFFNRGPSGAYRGWEYAQARGIPFFLGKVPRQKILLREVIQKVNQLMGK